MATRVLITVDTELVWRHHAAGHGWEENFRRSYEAAGVGVPYQLRVLAEHGLKACFFVDPMPALVHGLEPIRRMVEPILAAGQEVQLHLHPFWAHLDEAERSGRTAELTRYGYEDQLEMIRQARDLLMAAGAPNPLAFRAGSYAANTDTLRALAELGFHFDSSHNGSHHPEPSAISLPRRQVGPVAVAPGLIEIPVGQIEEKEGRLRHLQLCAISFAELRAALRHADRQNHPVATIVSHSFELATRRGLSSNGVIKNRFARLCAFLASRRDKLPTVWFSDLDQIPVAVAAVPAPGRAGRRLLRLAGQLWGDARYERPAESLTIAAGSSIAGAEMILPYVL
jgi:peptidoglycan/xylan/chitin deacetylase (PgdA/CDA1 family)